MRATCTKKIGRFLVIAGGIVDSALFWAEKLGSTCRPARLRKGMQNGLRTLIGRPIADPISDRRREARRPGYCSSFVRRFVFHYKSFPAQTSALLPGGPLCRTQRAACGIRSSGPKAGAGVASGDARTGRPKRSGSCPPGRCRFPATGRSTSTAPKPEAGAADPPARVDCSAIRRRLT